MRRWVVIAALLASCRKAPPAPSAPEQDALWKLAPLTATRGIVVSSRGLRALESAWHAINDVLDDAPELVALRDWLREERPLVFPSGSVSLARAGMEANGGAAFFFSRSGARLMFLPVVDRAKFLAFVNGTTTDDGDHIGNLTCRTVAKRYACAMPAELLGRIGEGSLGDHIKLAGTRGDVELAIEDTDAHEELGAVAQFERGTVVVRGAIRAARLKGIVVNASAQRFDTSKLAGFGVLNVGAALASLPIPREPLAAGVTLADLIGNMTGPIILSAPPGVRQGEVRVPMKDTNIARTLVTHCEDIPYLAILSSSFSDGACHLTTPGLSVEFDAWLDGTELRARTKNSTAAPAKLRPTAIANELASGEWAFSVYGRGTVVGSFVPSSDAIPIESMLGVRAITWINEGGVGVRADGDLLRFFVAVRTVWSNPDDVVAKWLTLPFEQLVDPAAFETVRKIVATTPTAPLADDMNAGTAVLAPVALFAIVAGLAAPAFLDKENVRDLGIGPRTPEELLVQLTAFKDTICACQELACAKRVSEEMTAWSQDQASRGYTPPQLDPVEQARATTIGEQMGACMQAVYGMGSALDASEYIAKNTELKDRLCACKDLACGEAVNRKLTTWSENYARNLPRGSRMSASDDRKVETIENEVRACMNSLRAGH